MYRFWIVLALIAVPLIAQEEPRPAPLPPPPPENVGDNVPFKRNPDGKTFTQVEPARLTLEVPKQVPVYNFVEIVAAPKAGAKDVMVMAVLQGEVQFIEVIQTAAGSYVFTGPPGKYSIRVTMARETGGFEYATSSVVIGQPEQPPPPPTPTDPPAPPPTDGGRIPLGDDILPPGTYGFAPVAFDAAVKVKNRAGLTKLAENFEWAATSKIANLDELIAELSKRNTVAVYNPPEAWEGFRNAWKDQADRLRENEVLPGTVEDHQICFQETAAGIRMALKYVK